MAGETGFIHAEETGSPRTKQGRRLGGFADQLIYVQDPEQDQDPLVGQLRGQRLGLSSKAVRICRLCRSGVWGAEKPLVLIYLDLLCCKEQ